MSSPYVQHPPTLASHDQLALNRLKSHLPIFQQRAPYHHSVPHMQMEFEKNVSAPNKSVKNGTGIMDGVLDGWL